VCVLPFELKINFFKDFNKVTMTTPDNSQIIYPDGKTPILVEQTEGGVSIQGLKKPETEEDLVELALASMKASRDVIDQMGQNTQE
jgi:hypothetical protein